MYTIKYNYDTGDSFGSEPNNEGVLGMQWEDVNVAKENMKRIEEHYKAYRSIHNYYSLSKDNKTWDDFKNERWYRDEYPEFSVKLLTGKGEETYVESTGSWTGYFETLNYVEVIEVDKRGNDFKIYM